MKSVVKHSYIRSGPKAKATAKAHLNYIQHRGGHDKELGGRTFFDRDREDSSGADFRRALARASDYGAVMHKLILSPGCKNVNLQEYTREVVEALGDSKGLELQWHAVIHKNTDHDHVHVAILGRDAKGRQLKLDRHDHDYAREIGDKYLERKHEFDRYFENTLENIVLKEAPPERGLDLEKLFKPFRPEKDKKQPDKQDPKGKEDKEFFSRKERPTQLPARKKGRKQRLMDARGRNDFYHDLYVSNMNRQRLNQLKEAKPELEHFIEQELAQQDRHDAVRREEIAKKVAELDRILGIAPAKTREKKTEIEQKKGEPEKRKINRDEINLELIATEDKLVLHNGDVISKYDTAEFLKAKNNELKSSPRSEWLNRDDYGTLWTWINSKERFGDNCFGDPPIRSLEKDIDEKAAYVPVDREDIDLDRIASNDKILLKNGEYISKYDSAEYLKELDTTLQSSPKSQWLDKNDYKKLHTWIGAKDRDGEGCYGNPPLLNRDEKEQELEQTAEPVEANQPDGPPSLLDPERLETVRVNGLLDELRVQTQSLDMQGQAAQLRALHVQYTEKIFRVQEPQELAGTAQSEVDNESVDKKETPNIEKEHEPEIQIEEIKIQELEVPIVEIEGVSDTPTQGEVDEKELEIEERKQSLDYFEKLVEELKALLEARALEEEKRLKEEQEREEKEREEREKEER